VKCIECSTSHSQFKFYIFCRCLRGCSLGYTIGFEFGIIAVIYRIKCWRFIRVKLPRLDPVRPNLCNRLIRCSPLTLLCVAFLADVLRMSVLIGFESGRTAYFPPAESADVPNSIIAIPISISSMVRLIHYPFCTYGYLQ
jgi:hypothetical protein